MQGKDRKEAKAVIARYEYINRAGERVVIEVNNVCTIKTNMVTGKVVKYIGGSSRERAEKAQLAVAAHSA